MAAKVVFMFPGQGSQYMEMGQELYRCNPVFQNCMNEFSEVALPLLGIHLATELFADSQTALAEDSKLLLYTRYSNPLLFTFNYAVAATIESMGVIPDLVLGYSLGELTAAAYSGAVDRFQLLVTLIRASFAFESYTPVGGMLAILDGLNLWHQHPDWFQDTALASINCSQSFVVSGRSSSLDRLEQILQSQSVLFQRLPVIQAFHSPWLDSAQEIISREFDRLPKFQTGRFWRYGCGDRADDPQPAQSARTFWEAFRDPINFEKALRGLESMGTNLYLDVGSNGTLAGFVRVILNSSSPSKGVAVMDRFGQNVQSLERAINLAKKWRSD